MVDWGDVGAVGAIAVSVLSAWLTYRAARKGASESATIAEGDLTLRRLAQLNEVCMQRCADMELREQRLLARIDTLETECRDRSEREHELLNRIDLLESEIRELRSR